MAAPPPGAAVGVGWLLVELSPADAVAPGSPSAPGPVTLYLVDPDGGRYDITTVQSTGDAAPGNLVAWSGDGRRALFTAPIIIADRPAMRTKVTELDLTDASTHSFTVTGIVQDAGYTRPTGQSIMVSVGNGLPTTLERPNRSGTIEITYPAAFATAGSSTGGFLYTADGTEVIMGTTAGLEVVSNSGQPVTALPVPTGGSYCIPYQYLARLGAGGSTTPVMVPGVAAGDSVTVIGASGSRLAIRATIACGPGRGLAWYGPAAKALTPLLGPPLSAGSVSTALLFPT